MSLISPPLVGVTLETRNLTFHEEHACPFLTLPQNCVSTLLEAGGITVGIPALNDKNLQILLQNLNGILLYRQSIPPELLASFQDTANSTTKPTIKNENLFEFRLLKAAWEQDIPVLGIGGGAHYMTLFLEGELNTSQENAVTDLLPHEQLMPPHQGSHSVTLNPNSLLFSLTRRQEWLVNSFHNQSIKNTGNGIISAHAEDGTIEAIEDTSRAFFLGVQWHPEFTVDYTDRKIFSAFISKARFHAQKRS